MSILQPIFDFFNGFNTVEEPDPYIEELEEKGFHYNTDSEWWQRAWTTKTRDSTETVLEVRKKEEDGWKYVMYGDSGDVFYEYKVDGTK